MKHDDVANNALTPNEQYGKGRDCIEKIYDMVNEKYYSNELTKPVITLQEDFSNRTLGWFQSDAWLTNNSTSGCDEINISAQFLNLSFLQIVEIVMHEMVHQYCKMKGISDTSRAGTYHNKNYKVAAESHGLKASQMKLYGFARTELTKEAKAYFKDFEFNFIYRKSNNVSIADELCGRFSGNGNGKSVDEVIDEYFERCGKSPISKEDFKVLFTRMLNGDRSVTINKQFMSIAKKIYNLITGKNIRSSSTRTYYCPKCQTSVRATKTVNIICGDCNETMVERTINLTLKANSDVRESVD